MESIKVVVLGTGQMGSGIIQLLLQKQGIELVGVYGRRAERSGIDVGEALGLATPLGIHMTHNLPSLLDHTQPHLAIQATCSTVAEAMDEITTLLSHRVNVISIAEEMAYPAYRAPSIAEVIHALAIDHDVTIVGTGINPGFVLDFLVIALTGVCHTINAIAATRINDLSPYGPSVLRSQGVGLTPKSFFKGVADGSVVGHIGFPESISMIANAIGWPIDRIEQHRAPIISNVRRETPFVTVKPGLTAGCKHTAVAYMNGAPVIRLIHPQQIHPHLEQIETGDVIEIVGEPNLHIASHPEIPGGIGTTALAVNMIPRVISAEPGLKSMADLPPPAAILGDIRALMDQRRMSHV